MFRLKDVSRSLNKAVTYLKKHQRKDGSWLPLWFGNQHERDHKNPVYGTARVLTYLNDALPQLENNSELYQNVLKQISSGEKFLVNVQNADGSWGGHKNIPGTIEETSLAISALQKEEFAKNRKAGFEWLDNYFKQEGLKAAPIGLYFASLWYDEKMYPLTAYLEAVVRSMQELGNGSV